MRREPFPVRENRLLNNDVPPLRPKKLHGSLLSPVALSCVGQIGIKNSIVDFETTRTGRSTEVTHDMTRTRDIFTIYKGRFCAIMRRPMRSNCFVIGKERKKERRKIMSISAFTFSFGVLASPWKAWEALAFGESSRLALFAFRKNIRGLRRPERRDGRRVTPGEITGAGFSVYESVGRHSPRPFRFGSPRRLEGRTSPRCPNSLAGRFAGLAERFPPTAPLVASFYSVGGLRFSSSDLQMTCRYFAVFVSIIFFSRGCQ